MVRLVIIVALCIIPALTFAGEDKEPSIGYTIHIGNKTVRLYPGQEKTISGKFDNPKIRIEGDKERLFEYANMKFKYPAYFTFEADVKSEAYKNWTLSGNDVKIMIFVVQTPFTPEDYVYRIQSKFGKNTRSSSVTHNLGGKLYKGKRVELSIGGSSFMQDALMISTKKKHTMMVIQDTALADKLSDKETNTVLKLLKTTFRTK